MSLIDPLVSRMTSSRFVREEPYWVVIVFTDDTSATSAFKDTNCSGATFWRLEILVVTDEESSSTE